MKFSALAGTTSLFAFALVANSQNIVPASSSAGGDAAFAATSTDALTELTALIASTTATELSATGTETSTATSTDLAGGLSSIASDISSQISSLATSSAIAGAAPGASGASGASGAPGANGAPGSPGAPGAPATPVSSTRATASMQTSGFSTGTAVRPSFFPSLTPSATSINAASTSIGHSGGMLYALLLCVAAALF